MDMYILLLILLWGIGSILFIAFLLLIFLFGRHTVKDNPTKALIFLKTGKHINSPMVGKLAGKPTKSGSRYTYGKNTIFVPAGYGDNYYKNKRMIFINRLGQLIASPFDGDISLSDDEKNELIYDLVSSKIGSDSIKALQGFGKMNIIIIAVVAFVLGIIAVFGYNYMQTTMVAKQSAPVKQEQNIKITPAP